MSLLYIKGQQKLHLRLERMIFAIQKNLCTCIPIYYDSINTTPWRLLVDKKWFKLNTSKVESYCKKYHIISFALFGSILAPKFNSSSDIDILIRFDEMHIPILFGIVDMEFELTNLIGRPVDLKTPEDLSPYFRNEVISQAEVIYRG